MHGAFALGLLSKFRSRSFGSLSIDSGKLSNQDGEKQRYLNEILLHMKTSRFVKFEE